MRGIVKNLRPSDLSRPIYYLQPLSFGHVRLFYMNQWLIWAEKCEIQIQCRFINRLSKMIIHNRSPRFFSKILTRSLSKGWKIKRSFKIIKKIQFQHWGINVPSFDTELFFWNFWFVVKDRKWTCEKLCKCRGGFSLPCLKH